MIHVQKNPFNIGILCLLIIQIKLQCLFEWTPSTKEGKWVSHISGIQPHVLGLALVTPPTRSYLPTESERTWGRTNIPSS